VDRLQFCNGKYQKAILPVIQFHFILHFFSTLVREPKVADNSLPALALAWKTSAPLHLLSAMEAVALVTFTVRYAVRVTFSKFWKKKEKKKEKKRKRKKKKKKKRETFLFFRELGFFFEFFVLV
jgi:uncharacterized protein (DUF2062 family)